MKAAAALTSLLMHNHRGSASLSVGAGSASSPRSSIDGAASEAGSAASYSHYMQSSARSFSDTAASSQTLVPEGALIRPHTPAGSVTSESRVTTTPRPDPTDNEAADLMLFLATSPSPARPTTNKERNNRDLAAFRTLSTNNDRPKGRVLFATTPAPPGPILEDSHRKSLPTGQAKPLARGGASEASLASSMSSIGSYMGVEPSSRPANVVQKSGRSTPTNQPTSQLLPPPSFSAPRHATNTAENKSASPQVQNPYPPSSTVEFNINEFINASPSPRTSKTATSHFDPSGAPKPNLSLRADVGRKLFEEEQIRLGALRGLPDGMGASLGAGIDLSS
ncbi:hypothetical protein ONZ45_g17076 [Pleurotus djamor]|nr:hypothetical protein ONZ45_g17076 [Pleurotus djamor]